VEITVYGGLGPISPAICSSGIPISTLSQSMQSAMLNPAQTFGDLTIVMSNEEITVHKCVLCSRSEVFMAMLNAPMSEALTSKVYIDDIDIDVMRELIKFMYTDVISSFTVLDSMLYELYGAASKYQVHGLVSICEGRMIETLGNTNCLPVFKIADTYDAEKLKASVMHYIVQHYMDVCATEGYKQIVSNYDKDEQATILLNEINAAMAHCNTYRHNCLGLMGSVLHHGSSLTDATNNKLNESHSNNYHKISNNGCTIS